MTPIDDITQGTEQDTLKATKQWKSKRLCGYQGCENKPLHNVTMTARFPIYTHTGDKIEGKRLSVQLNGFFCPACTEHLAAHPEVPQIVGYLNDKATRLQLFTTGSILRGERV